MVVCATIASLAMCYVVMFDDASDTSQQVFLAFYVIASIVGFLIEFKYTDRISKLEKELYDIKKKIENKEV